MYNMVSARRQFAVSALVADAFQDGKPDYLFRRSPFAEPYSPSIRVKHRPDRRTSARAAELRRQASQLSLSLRTLDGSVKYRVNCEFDELGHNEQFFRPHVEDEREGTNKDFERKTVIKRGRVQNWEDDVAPFPPNADWQFDATDWPQAVNFSYESPPYSHEIYAGCSANIGCYPVELNEIDAALDCDISTLDAYLHSPPSCSTSTELLPHSQPPISSTASAQASAPQPSSTLDAEPLEEFFPDLCEVTTAPPVPQLPERRRKVSAASTRSSTSRYSPYSIDSAPLDADVAYSEYRIRRDKNNLASQRSRQKRMEKLRQMKDEKEILERRNIELKTLLSSLEVQVADYKRMVLMFVQKSA